jgi:hypothetical protein
MVPDPAPPLVKHYGSREAAVRAILQGIRGSTPAQGTFQASLRLQGQEVVVRGSVVRGVVRLGTVLTP